MDGSTDTGTTAPAADAGTPREGPPDAAVPVVPGVPASTWTEHWYEHKQTVRLATVNDDVALYLDPDLPAAEADWIPPFVTNVWKYTKQTYGDFGVDARSYWVLHKGRLLGGHVGSYLDASHDFRNTIDLGAASWAQSPAAIKQIATFVSVIAERFNNGVRGTPASTIWRGHWAAAFEVDLYVGLGMEAEAQETHGRLLTVSDAFPRAGTFWYRDWFFPIWQENGGPRVTAKFFRLLAQHYPKRPDISGRGLNYARTLNWGEFVHFMSGAAGRDLKPLATMAFGWPPEWTTQLAAAKAEFPAVTY
ncbi:MAG TPA: hypothetical protein VGF45_09905 [Polyangia bacterium]